MQLHVAVGVLLLALLASCHPTAGTAAAPPIRGLNPSLAQHYEPGADGKFRCIDGSNKIDFSRVNDNYCDCFDGSDEPGTAACYDGRFYCANRGDQPKLLAAAFVDDEICDCCDGSDEASGMCRNTCLDKSLGQVKALEEQIASYQEALVRKASAIKVANARRAGWATRKDSIDMELESKQAEVQTLSEAKAKADQVYQEAQRARREARERELEQRRLDDEEAARKAAEQAAAAEQAGGEGQDGAGAGVEQQEGETAEERGRRIASQWTTDPDAAATDAGHDGEHDDDHLGEHFEEGHDDDHHDLSSYRPEHYQHDDDASAVAIQQAVEKLNAAEAELQVLKAEKRDMDLVAAGGHDFGPNEVFFPLAGKCYTDQGMRFKYEVCFYDKASQSEGFSNTNLVSLGTWKGFNQDYSSAVFENGDPCTDAPARSLQVHLECGVDERLYDASEPSTCMYEVHFTTPQACTEEEHRSITAELIKLELERKTIQDEIDAAHKDEL